MQTIAKDPEGLRAHKRRRTRQQIIDAGLKLFVAHGYEATTLNMITEAAGISRRTFFYYFKSKDDVLLARSGSGFPQALHAAMLEQSPDQTALAAARNCFLSLSSHYETRESLIVDRLLRSTEALKARKTALFVEIEQSLFDAMCKIWPDSDSHDQVRIAAMIAVGVLRLALDAWRQDAARLSLATYLRRYFNELEHLPISLTD